MFFRIAESKRIKDILTDINQYKADKESHYKASVLETIKELTAQLARFKKSKKQLQYCKTAKLRVASLLQEAKEDNIQLKRKKLKTPEEYLLLFERVLKNLDNLEQEISNQTKKHKELNEAKQKVTDQLLDEQKPGQKQPAPYPHALGRNLVIGFIVGFVIGFIFGFGIGSIPGALGGTALAAIGPALVGCVIGAAASIAGLVTGAVAHFYQHKPNQTTVRHDLSNSSIQEEEKRQPMPASTAKISQVPKAKIYKKKPPEIQILTPLPEDNSSKIQQAPSTSTSTETPKRGKSSNS